jgi:sialate O-acetylesterase
MALASAALAEVSLPHIFSDHMVLQQKKPIPVWGKAAPGEVVTVTFAGQTQQTVTDNTGKWLVYLKARNAKAGQTGQPLTVSGTNTVTFQDVLLGEVWICSGQSNMQMAVNGTINAEQEIANAKYPQIRLFTVPLVTAVTPQENCGGRWSVCSPETVPGFSAVGYYFGRYLHAQLKVPVGLINTSWGGTIAEAWTSAPALRAKLPEFNAALDELTKPNVTRDQANVVYQQALVKRQQAMETMYAMEDDLASAGKLAATDLNDGAWKTMKLPGDYKALGMPDVDGIVWFRKTIEVPAAWAGKEIILRPGPIDEVDNTWFNGVLVGGKGRIRTAETGFWNMPREYHVPGNLVKAGKNVIAIRVFNAVGQGGLWGAEANTLYAEVADGSDKTHVALAGEWRAFAEFVLPNTPQNPETPNVPSKLYNAMIHPLIPYAIQGAIWYQGESNVGRALQYQTLLPTMISDWRTRWNEGDFTFLIVSLANFMARTDAPVENGWADLREAQTLTTTALPKVGQAMTIDIGDAKDIHPKNKQDVGLRLGLAARAIAYEQKLAYSGPVFQAMKVQDGKAELTFQHTDGGLVAKGDTLKGFAICGADKKFVWAQAKIDGDKVIVWADGIAQPTAVRYAWANNPECNLYNGAGLPAVSFRTDRQ